MSKIMICTKAEAMKEINKRRGIKRMGYGVFVRPFLPTTSGKGFEGCAIAKVTKKEFVKMINDLLEHVGERGAKIELTVPVQDYESFYI